MQFNSLPTIVPHDLNSYTELHPNEIAMVRAWRTVALDEAILRIQYRASIPIYLDWYLDNGILEQIPSDADLTPFEIEVVQTGRQIGYGELHLTISRGSPLLILGDSYKRIKLDNN